MAATGYTYNDNGNWFFASSSSTITVADPNNVISNLTINGGVCKFGGPSREELEKYCQLKDEADVTAWGEAEPKYLSDDSLLRMPDMHEDIRVASRLISKANLTAIFDEAVCTSACIVWRDSLPTIGSTPASLKRILEYMLDIWGELPPYIEVAYHTHDLRKYSIKPVWELTW